MDEIESVAAVRDYGEFVKKMVYYIDDCNSDRVLFIDDQRFENIKDIVKRSQGMGPKELLAVSRLYYKGLKFDRNKEKAKSMLDNDICKDDAIC